MFADRPGIWMNFTRLICVANSKMPRAATIDPPMTIRRSSVSSRS